MINKGKAEAQRIKKFANLSLGLTRYGRRFWVAFEHFDLQIPELPRIEISFEGEVIISDAH